MGGANDFRLDNFVFWQSDLAEPEKLIRRLKRCVDGMQIPINNTRTKC